MAELGILLRIFFSHDVVIRLSKRSEDMDDLTADLNHSCCGGARTKPM
jgi:hypothetical protein